jgi:hypothetical protein
MQITETTMTAAAANNKLAVVQYLHSQGCPWPWQLLENAASSGHLDLVRWCYEQGSRFADVSTAACEAAASGNVALMA